METKFILTQSDRDYLQSFKKSGNRSLREFNRAAILIFLEMGLTISETEDLLDVPINCYKRQVIDYKVFIRKLTNLSIPQLHLVI